MDTTRSTRPDSPHDGDREDASVQRKGRAFFTSMTVTWATVILLSVVFLALIIAFAAGSG